MCTRTLTKDISKQKSKQITLCGWVHRIRTLGKISFVLLRDRAGIAQIVCDDSTIIPKLETVVQVTGTLVENKKAPHSAEIHSPVFAELSYPQKELPIQINAPINDTSLNTLLNNRILSLRIPKLRAVFEIQDCILHCFTSFLRSHDFTEVKTSKLISVGTEGGTELFEVSYFDTKVYLAQSPQFYKQASMASGLERVFEIGAVYRAEKHETTRHINEYISLDIEMAFIENIDILTNLQIGFLQLLSETLHSKYATQLHMWDTTFPQPQTIAKIPRFTYDEAKKIAAKISGGRVFDIDSKAEKLIGTWAEKQYGINAAFITEFPRKKRPFYTMPHEQKTKGFDLLFNGLEISTGGLRIHNYTQLCESAKDFGLKTDELKDYLSIFRYGCPPHGGFAIGLERLTQQILRFSNVRLASMFPRDRNRIRP